MKKKFFFFFLFCFGGGLVGWWGCWDKVRRRDGMMVREGKVRS